MKTLYKRLKPKVKKAVDDEAKIHPFTYKPVITELKLVKYETDLSISSAIKTHGAFYPIKPFRSGEYYELFND
jgi:hypothetical protein